ncbi:MAG: hypothetical protein H0V17_20790 [Deltaproteobacteria bacterium]|nr:hypothetical protein [Deltaproteobacteria bacterium]
MKSLIVASLVIVALPAPADAQLGRSTPVPTTQVDQVDEDVALGLSLGGTVVSWGLLIASAQMENGGMATLGAVGTMFAPSLGHWYSHKVFTRGLGLRALGIGAATIAFGMALDDLFEEDQDGEGTIAALLLVGAGLYVAGTVDDIATASGAARKYNTRFENVTVVPTANAHGGGVSLIGRF